MLSITPLYCISFKNFSDNSQALPKLEALRVKDSLV
jgi:hypothetical protein